MSFLENENQMVIDAEYSYIGEQLVEDWVNSNLDEGQFYADKCFAEMCESNYLKGRFNQFYNLKSRRDDGLNYLAGSLLYLIIFLGLKMIL